MKACVVNPVNIKIGGQHFREQMYVVPIEDDMLLGLDVLRKHDGKSTSVNRP